MGFQICQSLETVSCGVAKIELAQVSQIFLKEEILYCGFIKFIKRYYKLQKCMQNNQITRLPGAVPQPLTYFMLYLGFIKGPDGGSSIVTFFVYSTLLELLCASILRLVVFILIIIHQP